METLAGLHKCATTTVVRPKQVPTEGVSSAEKTAECPQRTSQWGCRMTEATSNSSQPPSIEALQNSDKPFVLADAEGLVTAINQVFEDTYGWTIDDLKGQTLNRILPSSFHMAHQLGFSRYLITEKSTILAHPLQLKTICSDGREVMSEHFIVAERRGDSWVFGATITPL